MDLIKKLESNVRSYCRSFPKTFTHARGAELRADDGSTYIDFFAGAGALNYGHNNPALKEALLDYLQDDGIIHSLDMTTEAKRKLLGALDKHILKPRQLDYKVMFPGPTGTNSVEAAIKLARKITGRTDVVAFTNGFHGMTLGSLALTGNQGKREGAGVPLLNVIRAPFCGYHGDEIATVKLLETMLEDHSSGVDQPAAFIVETVQAEGGVNVATASWLQQIAQLAKSRGALLIVDDIQVGCGRAGQFFSFEKLGVKPDIVCLSKSLSGLGLPFALTLFRPELDAWEPGEHNGTFRGFNLAFVTATAAIEGYWRDDRFARSVASKTAFAVNHLDRIARAFDAERRGRGMVQGLEFSDDETASKVSKLAFERGLIIETAGSRDQVLKFLPPLTIEEEQMRAGFDIVEESLRELQRRKKSNRPVMQLVSQV